MCEDLKIIIDIIVEELNPVKIYLFGSRASETNKKNSDFDLCVIVDKKTKRKIDMSIDAELALVGITNKATDIIVQYEDKFQARSNYIGTLEYTIMKEGKIIYEFI